MILIFKITLLRDPSQQVELLFYNKISSSSSDNKLVIGLVETQPRNNSALNIKIKRRIELSEELCVKAKYLVHINLFFIYDSKKVTCNTKI